MERRVEQGAGVGEEVAKIAVNLCVLGRLVNANLSLGYLTICENPGGLGLSRFGRSNYVNKLKR